MPPADNKRPITDTDYMLPPHRSSAGPIIGAVIVVVLLLAGAVYFWSERSQRTPDPLPLISGEPAGE